MIQIKLFVSNQTEKKYSTSHLRSQWQISKELFLWEKLDENTPQGG